MKDMHGEPVLLDASLHFMTSMTKPPSQSNVKNYMAAWRRIISQESKLVHWNSDGTTIVVEDFESFALHIMPQYFGYHQVYRLAHDLRVFRFIYGFSKVQRNRLYLQHPYLIDLHKIPSINCQMTQNASSNVEELESDENSFGYYDILSESEDMYDDDYVDEDDDSSEESNGQYDMRENYFINENTQGSSFLAPKRWWMSDFHEVNKSLV